ncbi:uncharacterized protein T551_00910 [Pneumocystis jirovecii RU7]|uniref:Major surface glycoprotein 2 C-terminal domain-containing protein n=2 Tax=Pneumocystis jirovecii TaxID=42068 RepID=A0A0W4ZV40_PNEJ7|nr:uncharacterized protein T551_00910 [Pneumocystis jirovecii RU7]KTW32228.1 hypothetical protein T551_00910 [Pneumocystis jirovecii RU7]
MARAVARAVKRQVTGASGVDEEEVRLLALILKEDSKDDKKCEEKLEKHCKELSEANLTPEQVHEKLKDFCDSKKRDKKCKELKKNVEKKCGDFKTELEELVKKEASNLKNDECTKNEQQCLFLEEACSDLTKNCNDLRNKCYQNKRDKVAKEVLLRIIKGKNFKDKNSCENKLEVYCQELSQMSDELMKLCFDQKNTCDNLVKETQQKCESFKNLKTEIKTIKEDEQLKKKCPLLYEECIFYDESCGNDSLKCSELEKKCQEKNITYTLSYSGFDPIEPEITLAEEVDLEGIYRKAAEEGTLVGKPLPADATALVAFLIQDPSLTTQRTNKEKCKKILEDKCKNLKEHDIIKGLCEDYNANKDKDKKCEELSTDIEETCKFFISKTLMIHFFGDGNKNDGIIKWGNLSTFLSNKDCTKLESYCLYFEKSCRSETACKNIRAACYKRGLDTLANEVLQKEMRGMLHGSNKTWLSGFQKKLIEVCKKVKKENKGVFPSNELFVLCVQPSKAARLLSHDLRMKTIFLQDDLNRKRDFPVKEDCEELLKKCEALRKDSKKIEWPCHTLSQNCDQLRNAKELKELLLNEHKDILKNQENCGMYLKEKCNEWSRRRNERFSLLCALQNRTCRIMVEDVKNQCKIFEKNIKKYQGIDSKTKIEELGTYCPIWHPHCHRFGPNCPDLEKNKCEDFEKYCKPYYKQRDLENALIFEFRGHLDKKKNCKTNLDKYCTLWDQTGNKTLKGFCNSSTDNNETFRDKLCEKLVQRVKEKCQGLSKELEKAKNDLEEKHKDYEKVKKDTKNAMEETNLVFSTTKSTDNKTEKGVKPSTPSVVQDIVHFKLVKRNEKVQVTEKEAKAFDLVALAFSLYVELKETCHHLKDDCEFRKECKCKDQCKEIEKICLKIEPLKVKPHEIKTVTETNITTVTETVKEAEKTVGDGEKCKSLSTTDTWVTKTSTHTSTSTTTSTVTSRITLTSTRRCKPTKCTTGEEDEAGEVKPSEGLRMSGWSVMRGVLLAMMISFMI